jgi:hypothetical protein
MVALGSAIGIADAGGPYAASFLIAALFIPIAFLIAAIAPWMTHARTTRKVTIAIVAFPWVYTVFFFVAAFTLLVKQ